MTALEYTHGGADLSETGAYRYRLWRVFDDAALFSLCFVMLNPSTADATKDDATIRRCMGFGRTLGYNLIMVVNLFAYRATDPLELRRFSKEGGDVVGPDTDVFLREEMRAAPLVVAAWGNPKPWMMPRVKMVLALAEEAGATLHALGTTKGGHPRHPLYLKSDAKPVVWEMP